MLSLHSVCIFWGKKIKASQVIPTLYNHLFMIFINFLYNYLYSLHLYLIGQFISPKYNNPNCNWSQYTSTFFFFSTLKLYCLNYMNIYYWGIVFIFCLYFFLIFSNISVNFYMYCRLWKGFEVLTFLCVWFECSYILQRDYYSYIF